MADYSLHAYDADVWVREFRGLNQADIGLNPNLSYAAEVENIETPNGVLQPKAADVVLNGTFEDRVETLAVFHRRWYTGQGSNEWYVACAGGKFYQKQKGTNAHWQPLPMPSGVETFTSSLWSWVTYEINPEVGEDTVDVLLVSNAEDGMYMIVPPDKPTTWGDLKLTRTWGTVKTLDNVTQTWGDTASPQWMVTPVDTQGKKFGVIERFAERIWGAAIADNPDMLMYSRPYDPTDWTEAGDDEEPEDGAGDILQPSWDGDKFYALKAFGDQLLAFKKNRIWRVMGTNPGEYNLREQFGGGTSCYETIAVDTERVFMADRDGLSIYDGMTVAPYLRPQVEQIWKTVNTNALYQMCGVMYKHKYYLSIPTGDSTVNNAVLVYDFQENTILFYKDMKIESWLHSGNELYATSSDLPGRILEIHTDSWTDGTANGKASKWVSPWIDFGYKRIVKGGFDLYFFGEVKTNPVTLKFTIETEKKAKEKSYTIQPTSGKEHRAKRLHFGGTGRKFRIKIETAAGVTDPWRIVGGLQLVVETDPD